MNLDKKIEHFARMLTEHELRELTPPDCEARTFYMRKLDTRHCAVLLTFSPEGITISGDLMIEGRHPAIGCRGYSLAWFADTMNADYLASKFLPSKWDAEWAEESLEDLAKQHEENEDPETAAKIRGCKETVHNPCGCATYNALGEAGIDMDDWPSHRIDAWEMACLAAVQQRFAQLYAQHLKAEESDG